MGEPGKTTVNATDGHCGLRVPVHAHTQDTVAGEGHSAWDGGGVEWEGIAVGFLQKGLPSPPPV